MTSLRAKIVLLIAATHVALATPLPGRDSRAIFPVGQVRAGMTGLAKTVLFGEQIEEIQIEVVDVLRNYYPGQDVVLVRLLGPQAERIGVAAGMSGSPVYIEGRLLGAIAYRFGTFSKDPLAGVVPVEQMLPIIQREERRATLWLPERRVSDRFLDTWLGGSQGEDLLLPFPDQGLGQSLVPWPPLLVFTGFSESVLSWVRRTLQAWAPAIAVGGQASGRVEGDTSLDDLQPGSPVALVLVAGDATVEAVGTVTWRDGEEILAFGHSVFDAGPIALPMARVRIATTIPSLYASEKLPLIGDLIGTFYQDRLTGTFGKLGPLPDLTPVKVRCWGADASERTYNFRVALDPSLRTVIPFYLRVALINALESSRMSGGDYSLRVRSYLDLNGNTSLSFENFYARRETAGFLSPMEDVLRSTMDIASAIASLMFNPFQPVRFDSLRLDVEFLPRSRQAEVMHLWYDRTSVSPGDSLSIVCTLLTNDGQWRTIQRRIVLPRNLPEKGRIAVNVGGGTDLNRLDMRNFPNRFQPVNFRHLLRILSSRRRNDQLYIQVTVSDAGLALGAKELPAPPPSLLAMFSARQSAGDVRGLPARIVLEECIPLDFEVTGIQTATLLLRSETSGQEK